MAKLFIFAIGGTGSRVLKSLTMLASGVRLENTDEVIPIVLDPHAKNKDLERTRDLLRHYADLRAGLTTKPTSGFFGTEIKTLRQSVGSKATIADTYVYELQGVQQEKFKDYINFAGLDPADKALASLLFSEENLETKMDIGFVGSPNIGSTVLNQFRYSDVFSAFASTFGPNDRIFIIRPIFGGTGAAGFPILLKNIRAAQTIGQIANPANLEKAKIGAVTVMPYFNLSPSGDDDNRIDPSSFVSKTKAALNYYQRNVNPSVNALYYIGDDKPKAYTYDPGNKGQQNEAHVVEMAAALAIVDFMSLSDSQLSGNISRKFGVDKDELTLQMNHLAPSTQKLIALPLTKMALLSTYLNKRLNQAASSVAWTKTGQTIDSQFLNSSFLKSLREFDKGFREWLNEMAQNKRTFAPLLLDVDNLGLVARGYEPKKRNLFGKETDVDLSLVNHYDDTLNKVAEGKTYVSANDKFISLFSEGTERFVRDYIPNLP